MEFHERTCILTGDRLGRIKLYRADAGVILPASERDDGVLAGVAVAFINDDLRNLIHKAKQEATLRGRYQPGIDPDFAVYWRQNILCSSIRALMSAAQRVTAHQRNRHHGPGVRGAMLLG